jgi:Uncharacterized protein conserved in bacteria (DUF2059)
MKRLFAALLFLLLSTGSGPAQSQPQDVPAAAASAPARPEHPATPEQIREYFKLIRLDQTVHNMIEQSLKSMQTTSAPYFPASLWDDMRKTFMDYDLLSDMVSVYQKYISTEDMEATLAFYHSAPGQRLLAAQPLMVADVQTRFREIGTKLGSQVAARHLDEINTAKKTYDEGVAAQQNSQKQK